MRRILSLLALGGIAVVAVAQVNGSALLTSFAKTLQSAKSVSSDYTVQIIGSAADSYSVTLEKPNKARIDSPTQLVVANGTEITTYDKLAKTYFVKPQTDADLKAFFTADELSLFSGFFNSDAYKAATVKDLGEKNRKGQVVQAVQTNVDAGGKKVVTYFLTKDSLARASQTDLNDASGKVTSIVDTKTFDVDSALPANAFDFQAPAGARKVSVDEMNAAKWYTDLDEAITAATKTNRKIFVDFMATWCGPCKMLDKEVLQKAEFKKLSSKMVFLRIDVDAQQDVAQHFGITAMPTQMVLDHNGNVIDTRVGYSNPSDFFAWLNAALR